jgi:hypothetical protein
MREAWMRPAVPIRGTLAAKILQQSRQRHTLAGRATDPLRNILDRLPLQNCSQAAVYALCQGLLEHAPEVR